MLSLADTTSLLDRTTTYLLGESEPLGPQGGIALIDSWLGFLQMGENTRPLADQLLFLRGLLATSPVSTSAVQDALMSLAERLSVLAADMGAEGEMPSLMEALSAAFRQAADKSKADQIQVVT